MPYITPQHRSALDRDIERIVFILTHELDDSIRGGALNYVLSKITVGVHPPISYMHIKEAVAALECAKLEYYRKLAGPYEDEKASENGLLWYSWREE